MKVIKRDNRVAEFDATKIIGAILKAFKEVDGEISDYAIAQSGAIAEKIKSVKVGEMYVERIQDIVEEELMRFRPDVARAYIIYRNDRNRERERKSKLICEITDKLSAKNIENQNANVDEKSFGGRIGAASSAVT